MNFVRYKSATQNIKKISCYYYYTIYFFESFWKRLFLYILNVYIWSLCVLLNLSLIKRRFLFYGFNAVPLCKPLASYVSEHSNLIICNAEIPSLLGKLGYLLWQVFQCRYCLIRGNVI